jgi:hypothetical protein
MAPGAVPRSAWTPDDAPRVPRPVRVWIDDARSTAASTVVVLPSVGWQPSDSAAKPWRPARPVDDIPQTKTNPLSTVPGADDVRAVARTVRRAGDDAHPPSALASQNLSPPSWLTEEVRRTTRPVRADDDRIANALAAAIARLGWAVDDARAGARGPVRAIDDRITDPVVVIYPSGPADDRAAPRSSRRPSVDDQVPARAAVASAWSAADDPRRGYVRGPLLPGDERALPQISFRPVVPNDDRPTRQPSRRALDEQVPPNSARSTLGWWPEENQSPRPAQAPRARVPEETPIAPTFIGRWLPEERLAPAPRRPPMALEPSTPRALPKLGRWLAVDEFAPIRRRYGMWWAEDPLGWTPVVPIFRGPIRFLLTEAELLDMDVDDAALLNFQLTEAELLDMDLDGEP